MAMEYVNEIFKEIKKVRKNSPGITIYDTPMFEIMAHPDPAGIFMKRMKHLGIKEPGISTSGVPIGIREDWHVQLKALKELGTEKFWLSIHGPEKIHDQYVGLRGAYSFVEKAVERIHKVGLQCGTNVYLNRENLAELPACIHDLERIGFDEYYFGIAVYVPHARFRRYEGSRPLLQDLKPHTDTIMKMDKHKDEKWERLGRYTESSWVDRALAAHEESDTIRWNNYYDDHNLIELACLENLDVHDGDISYPATLYGNIAADGLPSIIARAKEAKSEGRFAGPNHPKNFFGETAIPSISDLARQAGDRKSEKIHFHPASIRLRWLDLLFKDQRRL
jgi:hypothetical protein